MKQKQVRAGQVRNEVVKEQVESGKKEMPLISKRRSDAGSRLETLVSANTKVGFSN